MRLMKAVPTDNGKPIPKWVWGCVGAVILVTGIWAWTDTGSDPMPISMLGVWVTDAPRYSDRTLELTAEQIRFGTGNGNGNEFKIERVSAKASSDDGRAYTITYLGDEGGNYRLHLILDDRSPPHQLRLTNQPDIVWMKTELLP